MATAAGKILRRVTDEREQRQETYRYWQSRTCAERLGAVDEIVRDAYRAKGIDVDKLPSNRTMVRVERALRQCRAGVDLAMLKPRSSLLGRAGQVYPGGWPGLSASD